MRIVLGSVLVQISLHPAWLVLCWILNFSVMPPHPCHLHIVIKLFKEDTGINPMTFGNSYLAMTQKSQGTKGKKEKTDKLDFIKILKILTPSD